MQIVTSCPSLLQTTEPATQAKSCVKASAGEIAGQTPQVHISAVHSWSARPGRFLGQQYLRFKLKRTRGHGIANTCTRVHRTFSSASISSVPCKFRAFLCRALEELMGDLVSRLGCDLTFRYCIAKFPLCYGTTGTPLGAAESKAQTTGQKGRAHSSMAFSGLRIRTRDFGFPLRGMQHTPPITLHAFSTTSNQ